MLRGRRPASSPPGGAFVMEVFVPDLARFDREQRTNVTRVTPDAVVLDVSRHDRTTQRVDSQHVLLRNDGVRLFPVSVRYAWPAELDLMAQTGGPAAARARRRLGRRAVRAPQPEPHLGLRAPGRLSCAGPPAPRGT